MSGLVLNQIVCHIIACTLPRSSLKPREHVFFKTFDRTGKIDMGLKL